MTVHALIAARGGTNAKSRLSTRLNAQQRGALVEAMLTDMLIALHNTASVGSTWVVTPTPTLASIAARSGATILPDVGTSGLNGALESARTRIVAIDPGGILLVLPGDLPLVTPLEVDALLQACRDDTVAIAPANADGGTGALAFAATCPLSFAFGPDSFAKHLNAAHAHNLKTRVVVAPNIGLDIDRPADLDALLNHERCGRTGALVSDWTNHRLSGQRRRVASD